MYQNHLERARVAAPMHMSLVTVGTDHGPLGDVKHAELRRNGNAVLVDGNGITHKDLTAPGV
jgi:hypothetical protein